MRVLLDTTFARPPSGTAVYAEQLAAALRARGVEVVEARNPRRGAPGGGTARSAANYAADRWWLAAGLAERAREERADLVHHALPAHAPRLAVPQVVTVQDLAFERLPWAFDARFRRWARAGHRAAARRAGAVVCISTATARDVRSRWGVAPERVAVAPLGADHVAAEPERPAPDHLLYVGDAEPRKNLPVLLAAYRRYRERAEAPLPLVIAGAARAADPGVRPVGRVASLEALYAGAAALVHPALHEGFGLTPLEAMRTGTPVVAGRTAGVAEVCGDAALLVDPRDPEALAGAVAHVARDEALRADLGRRGRDRAAAFTWDRCAAAHVRAYTLALGR